MIESMLDYHGDWMIAAVALMMFWILSPTWLAMPMTFLITYTLRYG